MTISVVRKHDEPNHIYCGRGSPLGNPFPMRGEDDREAVCDKYEEWFYENVEADNFLNYVNAIGATRSPMINMLVDIYTQASRKDINLGCFCAPKRCHCDTIKAFIELKQEEAMK